MKQKLKYLTESLKVRLLKIAQTNNRVYDSVLLQFFQERFLYRLSVSKYSKNLILKGALLLMIKNVNVFRPTKDIDFLGIVITQIKDVEDFKSTYMDTFNDLGVKILGILPYKEELSHFTMEYLNQNTLGKVLAGEKGMQNTVKHIFVGAMSAANVVTSALWKLENKLIITPGDRRDMILAALESNTAGIVLTNNILPDDPILISKADIANIPLILVPGDTFSTAKIIDDMEILFTKDETKKIELLEKLITKNIDLSLF